MSLNATKQIYDRVRDILESAKNQAARSVNTAQVVANWLIGREIIEEEQQGKKRAGYGERVLVELSVKLKGEYGDGYSEQNLRYMRQFFLEYPRLSGASGIRHAVRGELRPGDKKNRHAVRGESWRPGMLSSDLSWTHYRTLLRVGKKEARAFYEIEAIKNHWSARELERQINSLFYERLALSSDKKGLMRLAVKGHEVRRAGDVFKDPVVMEFLGLPESPRLVESELEQALINNLQDFLLEMGKGFAFISRQERLTLDGDHFYVDLVFYHTVLKCYVLIDLKTGKLTHQDLGQLQLYVNYFDQERRTKGDNPTLGLILCADKNDAVVKYTLGRDREKKIFASRYKLHLPTELELKTEIQREIREFRVNESSPTPGLPTPVVRKSRITEKP
jgi:predicted nuclease of restriction endonuclease-like (RecB) superfamily